METAFLTGGVSLVGQEVAGPDTGPAIIDGGEGARCSSDSSRLPAPSRG